MDFQSSAAWYTVFSSEESGKYIVRALFAHSVCS